VPTGALYAGAVLLGAILGLVFLIIWRWFVPAGTARSTFTEMAAIAGALTRQDDIGAFGRLYWRLAKSLIAYLGRSLGGLALACLPMALAWYIVVPWALVMAAGPATPLALYPPELTAAAEIQASDSGSATLVIGDTHFGTIDPRDRTAICADEWRCLLFSVLGFDARDVATAATVPYVVVRPAQDGETFLWPYLSGLEVAFLIAFLAVAQGAALIKRHRP